MNGFCALLFACFAIAFTVAVAPASGEPLEPKAINGITPEQASHFARLVLKSVHREYPHKFDHLANDDADVQTPRQLHPAFYGCFDWHSSVHGHWLLVRLLRLFPALPEAAEIRAALDADLTEESIKIEAAYFGGAGRQSFERTYGWAWLLKLDEELIEAHAAVPDAARWHNNLQPLTEVIVKRYLDFLPKQNYPIRTGVHPNTAFGLAFALDYARTAGRKELESLIVSTSRKYYFNDRNYPAQWEPGGEDFLSPALCEADLMQRVLEPAQFSKWFAGFLPSIPAIASTLLKPAEVTDRTDPKLVHLDGLNLSRAWCMSRIARSLSRGTPRKRALQLAAERHAAAALPHVASGDYVGEHWLASFALYMLSEIGAEERAP